MTDSLIIMFSVSEQMAAISYAEVSIRVMTAGFLGNNFFFLYSKMLVKNFILANFQ